MFASLHVFALALSVNTPSIEWKSDYREALQQAESAKKPLAVFIGTGQDGWKTVSRDRDLDPSSRRVLTERYVCLYVDAATQDGKELAGRFGAKELPTLVLSDATRVYQAYRSSGGIPNGQLARVLQRHSGADDAVIRTNYYQGTPARTIQSCPT